MAVSGEQGDPRRALPASGQKQSEAIRSHQKLRAARGALKWQSSSVASSGQQWPAVASSGQQWSAVASSGEQRSSVDVNGEQWRAKAAGGPRERSGPPACSPLNGSGEEQRRADVKAVAAQL